MNKPLVATRAGSDSDLPGMQKPLRADNAEATLEKNARPQERLSSEG